MPKPARPELDGFLDKQLQVTLNANRVVTGKLMGFDPFMNVVLDQAMEKETQAPLGRIVIRGNSIIEIEALERVDFKS